MNKPSSESYKVYLEKSEATPGGICHSQPETRTGLPPSQAVTDAKVEPDVAIKCAKIQNGENRYPINSHIEKEKQFGPNN
jgi:hypothetical protein